jgi:hypothetical protein
MDDTPKVQHASAAAAVGAPEAARYEQHLSRSIGIVGNVFITLSGVTPAASVFIIVPVALAWNLRHAALLQDAAGDA